MSSDRWMQSDGSSPPATALELYPASLAQRRLWFLNELQAPTAAYNVYVGLWLYGALDVDLLQICLQQIVNRHDSLRTTFELQHGELMQRVRASCRFELPLSDFTHLSHPHPPAYELARQEVERPFDLKAGPLFRAHIMRIAPEEHVLLCTMHHTVTDAWSLQIFTNELSTLYQALATRNKPILPDLPIQYGDFSEWQYQMLKTQEAHDKLQYWKERLEGAPPILELPQDTPRPPEQTLEGNSQTYTMPDDVISDVLALAARHQVTPFMFLLAAFKVLLYRYSGQSDLLVGVPVAGRSEVETEALIGFFVETVVLRDDLSGNPRFVDLLRQVRDTTLDGLAHADIPFEQIVEAIAPQRNLSCNPIFQVMFSVIKSAIRSHAFGNVVAYPYIVNSSTSILDLFATFIEDSDGKWFLQIEFNTALFRVERIARMFRDLVAVLRGVTSEPEIRIDEIPVPGLSQPQARKRETAKIAGEHHQPAGWLATTGRRQRAIRTETEEELLLEVWQDVLGRKEIGLQDNFFDVGGHSLLAARLAAQIQQMTGRTIPVSWVFRAPTIELLATLLRDDAITKPDPVLMQLRKGESGLPLFAIAAPGVDSLGYALLARHLADTDSMYKLQSPGPAVWDRPFEKDELRSLARQYVGAMRTVQPTGPFAFVAMCAGVLIAQEMILQLESVGETVGFFAILDTWVQENSQIPLLWSIDYFLSEMRTFHQLPFRQQWAKMQRRLKRLAGRNHPRNKWADAYWPGKDFQQPRFRAPVLLFKRPKQPLYYVRDPQMGWGTRSTSGVEICEIHCGHYEFLRQPNVQPIAQKLSSCLRQVKDRAATTLLSFPKMPLAEGVGSDLMDCSI